MRTVLLGALFAAVAFVAGYGRPQIYNATQNAGLVLDFGSSQGALCVGLEVRGEPGFFGPFNDC